MSKVEAALAKAGHTLPTPNRPIANYVASVRTGAVVVVSGQIPLRDGAPVHTGKLGGAVSVEQGRQAAELCMLHVLAQLKAEIGDLDRVARVVRLGGFVACAADFTQHALVMNGASDLAVLAFGEAGRHARSTVGVASLPLDVPVEVEGMFEVV